MGSRRTRILAIATAVWTGLAGGFGLGLSALILPVLLLMSAIAHSRWPRASIWLMLVFVALLAIFTVPLSILVIRNGIGYQYNHFNYVVMHTLWIGAAPIVTCCLMATLFEVVRTLRPQQSAG